MRDLRKYARQTSSRLLTGGLLLVFVVGLGLIYIIYGPRAALTGLACLLAAFIPVLLVILALRIIEMIVKKANEGS